MSRHPTGHPAPDATRSKQRCTELLRIPLNTLELNLIHARGRIDHLRLGCNLPTPAGCASVYTPNGIKTLNARFHRAARRRGYLPTERATFKGLYLVIRQTTEESGRT